MIKLIISASNFGLSGVVSAVYNLVKHLVYTSRYEIIVIGEDKAHYSREFEKLGVRCILIEGRKSVV